MQEFIPNVSEIIANVGEGVPQVMPELLLSLAFLVSIFTGIFKKSVLTYWVTCLGVIAATVGYVDQFQHPTNHAVLFQMIVPDKQAACLKGILSFTYLLFLVFVKYHQPLRQHGKRMDDLLSVVLAIHIGLNLLIMTVNWLMAYIAIEMISVGSYILVAYLGAKKEQAEAALKYVLFGTACSAVMLYGLSLLYGYTGGLSLIDARQLTSFSEMPKAAMLVVMLFIFTGIGFKLAFVPFHFWTPDVYEGAPTPVTAFLSTAPKVAAIAFLARMLAAWNSYGPGLPQLLLDVLMAFSIASMLLGNLAAIRQNAVKRIMAYSSIGHTGFLLMVILTGMPHAFTVMYFYLVIYVIVNMGVFMLIDFIETKWSISHAEQYSGLGRSQPLIMTAMALLMISLIGLPPTAGFVAKLLAFSSVLSIYQESAHIGWLLLLITGALTTVIALFFYLKIPFYSFLRRGNTSFSKERFSFLVSIAVILAILSLLLGVFPALALYPVS